MARFQMQQQLLSVGDDSWIEDDAGRRRYKVDGKALRVRDTVVLKDAAEHEVATIQQRKLRARGTMKIEREGRTLATVHKAVVGIRDRFQIEVEDGEDLKAHGNVVDHEYEVERDGDVVATVSERWLRVRDTYGIEIGDGEDEALMLARRSRSTGWPSADAASSSAHDARLRHPPAPICARRERARGRRVAARDPRHRGGHARSGSRDRECLRVDRAAPRRHRNP